MKRKSDISQQESSKMFLEDNERQALRDSLISYMDRNPIKEVQQTSTYAPLWGITRGMWAAMAVLVLFAIGASISYAAEKALPGDTLYPVKVGFNEKVKGMIAFTNESKANLDVDLASRRLEEAEQLQASHRLTPAIQASLSQRFNSEVENIGADVKLLSAQDEMAPISRVNARFRSSLQNHAAIVPIISGSLNATAHAETSNQSSTSASAQDEIQLR